MSCPIGGVKLVQQISGVRRDSGELYLWRRRSRTSVLHTPSGTDQQFIHRYLRKA